MSSNRVLAAVVLASLPTMRIASAQVAVSRLPGPLPPGQASNDSAVGDPYRAEMGISDDGRWIVYESRATNLVPGLSIVRNRIFLFDATTQRTICVTPNADGGSIDPTISANGRFLVFASDATNLVTNDTNGCTDVFLVDRDPDGNGIFDEQLPYTFERINLDSSGNQTHGNAVAPSISDDGRYVLFLGLASDLVKGDNNGAWDAFLRDRSNGTTTRVDVSTAGAEATNGCQECALSGDGRTVVFGSSSDNLVTGDTNLHADVFLRDLLALTTTRITFGLKGKQSDGDSMLLQRCISRDGNLVAFTSYADNLDSRDTRGGADVFVYDRVHGTIAMVDFNSSGVQADGDCYASAISADGTKVAFSGWADNLAAGDTNYMNDVFVRDLVAGTTTCLSVSANGGTGDGESDFAVLTGDGTKAAFSSLADNIVDNGWRGGYRNVYRADLGAATVQYVSAIAAGQTNGPAGLASEFETPAVSADGRWIAFDSQATNLVGYDTNGTSDVFVADRTTGKVVRISVAWDGSEANGLSEFPAISADGRFVVFDSVASNLVPNDANGAISDIFRVDRDPDGNGIFDEGNAQITLVSADPNGSQGDGDSWLPAISADGNRIAFESRSSNLGSGSSVMQIYLRDLSGSTLQICSDLTTGLDSFIPCISGDGTTVAYSTWVTATGWDTLAGIYWTRGPYANQPETYAYGATYRKALSYDGSRIVVCDYLVGLARNYWVFEASWEDASFGATNPITTAYPVLNVPSISDDGNVIAFTSFDGVIPGDSNSMDDIFLSTVENDVYGHVGRLTTPVLVNISTAGTWPATGWSFAASLSADTYSCFFVSDASDLVTGDTNGTRDLFVADLGDMAATREYGHGYANGYGVIPRLTMAPAPVLGTPVTISLDNSSGVATTALFFAGTAKADVALPYGATILVDLATSTHFTVPVPATGLALPATIPSDPALDGISVDLQAIELDSTSAHHFTFSRGLDARFGH